MKKGRIQTKAMRHQNRPAGKIQIPDQGYPSSGRCQHRRATRRRDIDPVMWLAGLAIQNALAAIDAGDLTLDRHVETTQEITGSHPGIALRARRSHRCCIVAYPFQHCRRRCDMGLLQPVNTLDVIVALGGRDGDKIGLAAGMADPQAGRYVAVPMKSDQRMTIIALHHGLAVKGQADTRPHPCHDHATFDGAAGNPADAGHGIRKPCLLTAGRQRKKQNNNRQNGCERGWNHYALTLPSDSVFGTPKRSRRWFRFPIKTAAG